MLVSGMAAWEGSPQMGIGNAIGSNVINATLVLGAAALVRPLRIHSRLLIRELPVLLGIMVVAWIFLLNDNLSRAEGMILLAGMVTLVIWIGVQGRNDPAQHADPLTAGLGDEIAKSLPAWKAVFWFATGLGFLLVGAHVLVSGAVGIARGVDVSELVIGLTLVALGTSLPELAASIAAARRNEPDIAVGNVVGSNMFNLLGVLGLPGVIAPDAPVDHSVVTRDFPVMFGVTVLLIVIAVTDKRSQIGRKTGFLLVCLFVVYFVMLFVQPS